MGYLTKNEWEHFEYQDAHISDVQITKGFFHMVLDQVIILPENSCNRDIRNMRTNGLLFKIENGEVLSIVREGYKVYDADGRLQKQYEDETISAQKYAETVRQFSDGYLYSVEKEVVSTEEQHASFVYTFLIDAVDEHTYALRVKGTGDSQEWNRFLNLE